MKEYSFDKQKEIERRFEYNAQYLPSSIFKKVAESGFESGNFCEITPQTTFNKHWGSISSSLPEYSQYYITGQSKFDKVLKRHPKLLKALAKAGFRIFDDNEFYYIGFDYGVGTTTELKERFNNVLDSFIC